MTKVKICCITTIDEANLAIELGANALGFVSQMPSGPGIVSEEKIQEICSQIPQGIDTFLLTKETTSRSIIRQLQKIATTTVQLVDRVADSVYIEVRRTLPNVKIVQVVHVLDEDSIIEAVNVEPKVDAILLDSGRSNSNVLGGTGQKHDWSISRKICQMISKPVYLAGGLNSDNILEAIKFVRPYGVDLCSGVRSNGQLDRVKVEHFFNTLNRKP